MTQTTLAEKSLRGDRVIQATIVAYIILFLFAKQTDGLAHAGSWAFLVLGTIILLIFLGLMIYNLSPFHPLHSFPGPLIFRSTNFAMLYIVYTGRRHLFIARLHEKYGNFVRIGPNKLSILSGDAFHTIYASAKGFDKSLAYRPGHFPDTGLFFLRKREEHSNRRKAWAGAFNPAMLVPSALQNVVDLRISSMDSFASRVLQDRSNQMIELLKRSEGCVLDFGTILARWSYDVMGDLTFGQGQSFELLKGGDQNGIIQNGQKAMVVFDILGEIPAILDILWYLPATREIHCLERLAEKKLQDWKCKPSNGPELLYHLVQKTGEGDDGNQLLILDTVLAIQAGSDTIAGVLTLTIYHLLANQDVYQKLTQELDEYYLHEQEINVSSLLKLPYLTAVIWEGLRLGTPLPGLPRIIPKGGATISGSYVPGKTIVSVPVYAHQTSKGNFSPEPLSFRPGRWLQGGLGPDSVLDSSAMICFSSGAQSI
ncbi:hypothetical protein D9758_014489 [Tetrapyrgos nigripes]|uniref:Cytochrome P450 n=1 Tax=Tetrapyrgos nigripes TaxID=182062 RepID=A0A8H5FGG7_9AGAR|nr:hypothetical protein D9758_014489 [Tetrapyrgos nigripes]